jgi:rhodanese-related sulfurtransferase
MMTGKIEDIIQLLKNPLFEGMPEEILGEIANAVREEVKSTGAKIFRQNDEGNDFFIIKSGQVRVFKEGENGIEIDLNQLGPGDTFGEMALVTDRPRTATIEALQETHLLVLTKEQFEQILHNYPGIYANVVKYLRNILDKEEIDFVKEVKTRYEAPPLSWIDYVVILAVTLGIALVWNYSNPNRINIMPKFYDSEAFAKVSLSAAKEKYDSGQVLFIDARPDNFYNQEHIEKAINLPLPLFDMMYAYMMEDEEIIALEMDTEIIIYGRSISAYYDEDVAKKLELRGHKNIQIMKDGWSEWKKAGYPVSSEESSDSE